mgnify:CR=1 FL=1
MIEELLMNVVNAMSSCLDEEQLDKLQNVLYINFHGVRVVEEKNELQATGTDSDTAKMRLFVASKKSVRAAGQYTGAVYSGDY